MVPQMIALFALLACSTDPASEAPQPAPPSGELFHEGPQVVAQEAPPQRTQNREAVVYTKVMHRQYEGRELYIDGTHRGKLPLDVILPVGSHRFEILVGPADRLPIDVDLAPHPGVFVLQLGAE